MIADKDKKLILCKHLLEEEDELVLPQDVEIKFNYLLVNKKEYRVLTDEEAQEQAEYYIKETLWAFNLEFINKYISNDVDIFEDKYTMKAFEHIQEIHESANPIFKALIGDNLNTFIADAIKEDSRGHFMNSYDGTEHEINHDGITYFVYRTN